MVSYEEFVRFLEGEKTYNASWNVISPSVEKFVQTNASSISDIKAFRKAVRTAMVNEITSGKLPNTQKSLLNWYLPKCQEVLNQFSNSSTQQSRQGTRGEAQSETQPQEVVPDTVETAEEAKTRDAQSQPGMQQGKPEAPEYKKGAGLNGEFSTISKSALDRIGHEEVANYTGKIIDAIKAESKEIGNGIVKIDYVESTSAGSAEKEENTQSETNALQIQQSQQKESLESRIQKFKKLREAEAQPQQQSQTVQSDATQKNTPSDIKYYLSKEDAEALNRAKEDRNSEKLSLPQSLTFRIYLNENCMYWIYRSYDQIGEFATEMEAIKANQERIDELRQKNEDSTKGGKTQEALDTAQLYLKRLVEDSLSNERNENKGRLEDGAEDALHAIKNTAQKAGETVKRAVKGAKNKLLGDEGDYERRRALSAEIKSALKNKRGVSQYYEEFKNCISAAENEIVRTLQETRKAEVAKKPAAQQPYYPNFSTIDDTEKEPSYPLRKDALEKLKTINDNVKEKVNSINSFLTKETLNSEDEAALAQLMQSYLELVDTLKDLTSKEENRYVDVSVQMIPWNKKPKTEVTVSKNLMGISKSAQKWSKVFSGK